MQNSKLFLMSCENENCKWHLNAIFPCHRKTVGTNVHAFCGRTVGNDLTGASCCGRADEIE